MRATINELYPDLITCCSSPSWHWHSTSPSFLTSITCAITEKKVFTRIHAYPMPGDNKAYAFLDDGCVDTAFLKDNGISIVYTRGSCDNPDLTAVREGVYLLK